MEQAKLGDTVKMQVPLKYDASPQAQEDVLCRVLAGLPPSHEHITVTLTTQEMVDAYNAQMNC